MQGAQLVTDIARSVGAHPLPGRGLDGFGLLDREGVRRHSADRLAAALLGRPDTLILDEPGNGMDPQGMIWLRTFLKDYAAEGNTVFVSSHLLAEMQALADHVIVIGKGRLIADSSLEDFLRCHDLETVHVCTDEPAELADAMCRAGGVVEQRSGNRLIVRALSTRQVAELAAVHGCVVTELFAAPVNLEDAFLRASAESVEFKSSIPAT